MAEPGSERDPTFADRGPIAWSTRNLVAANLLMALIVGAGLLAAVSARREVFPEFSLDLVTVAVPYPGASPAEVEQGVVLAVEEQVSGVDGVKRVTSVAADDLATVVVELLTGYDPLAVAADVESAVARIQTFPAEAEEPTVSIPSSQLQVVSLVLAADTDLGTLHALAERARADLVARPEITRVELEGVPPLEIGVEVPLETLEAQGLTLERVAASIRAASLDLPGGGLDTPEGEVLVRVAERRALGEEIADVIVRGTDRGYVLRVRDIGAVVDGYASTDQASFFDGRPAVRLTVYRVGSETPDRVAAAVRAYADELRAGLPDGVTVAIWSDDSEILAERIRLLLKNAALGFVLVVVLLTLLLRARLAGWVALGIPVSFLGALALLPPLDVSVNMISLFAFIVTLGLVVDDAIIVGENVHALLEKGVPRRRAAVEGARQMVVPVTFSLLTTVAAFSPLFFVPGVSGKIMVLVPTVVVGVLAFSFVESFVILPAHLSHGRRRSGPSRFARLEALPRAASGALEWMRRRTFVPALDRAARHRGTTLATSVALLVVVVALVASGLVPFSFFPRLSGEQVTASVRLPYGAPLARTEEVRAELEGAAARAVERTGGRANVRGMYTRLGEGPRPGFDLPETGSHLVTVELALAPAAERRTSAEAIAAAWSEEMPQLAGIEALAIEHSTGPSAGAAVAVQLRHPEVEVLARASDELARALAGFDELTDVQNSWAEGKPRLDFRLRPEGRTLGLTSADLAFQLRAAFHGAEALREQRGRNELKVMVRLPEAERRSVHVLDRFLVQTEGGAVALGRVASASPGRAPTSIKREDGRRVVEVSAELTQGVVSARPVVATLAERVLPELRGRHGGLEAELVGEQRQQQETFASLGRGYALALLAIYALLAIPFRSYLQPLVVMSAIPFGLIGAVVGHLLMGYALSIISVFGIIALSGVVVNNSLVLIDEVNRLRAGGASAEQAVRQGAARRFRPIVLTSLTTFLGLTPMIFETSLQARFLIPMAISLGFGVLFSAAIGLVLVPALYLIVEDGRRAVARLRARASGAAAPDRAAATPV